MTIVDSDGLEALTMRSLAAALGTGAASLYSYVQSKDQLVELLVERVIGEVTVGDAPDPEHWADQITATAHELRATFARHGDLAVATFGRIPLGENALKLSEWIASVLRAGGMPDVVIGLACDLLPLYVMSIAYEDSLGSRDQVSPEDMRAFAQQMQQYFASLPADRFPTLIALAKDLTAPIDRFDFGLNVILTGLTAINLPA
jgi:TetR/AcrR family transcriptional regulator, tetracycline repressor protein